MITHVTSDASWIEFMGILSHVESGAPQFDSATGNFAPVKEWNCRHCTFRNVHADTCEMCSLPKD